MMLEFIANLIDLASEEIEMDLKELLEIQIECSFGIWSVLIPQTSQEVFFYVREGSPIAYHTNWYDEDEIEAEPTE